MIIEQIPQIEKLDKKEKLTLVGELWNSIIDEGYPKITAEEKAILDQRYQNYMKEPETGIAWKEIRAMIEKG